MPATKKNKRKIHVNGRDFYWVWNKNPHRSMTIMTPDKSFVAYYSPNITYEHFLWDSKLVFLGGGKIELNHTKIPELAHIEPNFTLETPDWAGTNENELLAPAHVRRVIVHIFETLM